MYTIVYIENPMEEIQDEFEKEIAFRVSSGPFDYILYMEHNVLDSVFYTKSIYTEATFETERISKEEWISALAHEVLDRNRYHFSKIFGTPHII